MATDQQHSAPGQAAGYAFQFERALYWLASSPPDAQVGLEVDDEDVIIRQSDGFVIREQDKHTVQSNARPFGNRSKALWNTLAIWLKSIESGSVSVDKTEFHLVTNRNVPDCIAKRIGEAQTPTQIAQCIADLKNEAATPPKDPDGVAGLMAEVMRFSDEALGRLIKHVHCIDANTSSASSALRLQVSTKLHLPPWLDAEPIVNELLGWLQTTTLELWRAREPAFIRRNAFSNQYQAILSRLKRERYRERSEHLIPISDEKVSEHRGRTFVQQLEAIAADDTEVISAIRQFLRCSTERFRLSTEGEITADDWDSFEYRLSSRWQKIRSRVMRNPRAAEPEDIGHEIFSDTIQHKEPLAGQATFEYYLTEGTYHRLADNIELGWHPDYATILKTKKET